MWVLLCFQIVYVYHHQQQSWFLAFHCSKLNFSAVFSSIYRCSLEQSLCYACQHWYQMHRIWDPMMVNVNFPCLGLSSQYFLVTISHAHECKRRGEVCYVFEHVNIVHSWTKSWAKCCAVITSNLLLRTKSSLCSHNGIIFLGTHRYILHFPVVWA